MPLPQKSRIVIIGGGVIGCSIAYHLAKRGARDVLLLERLQLTHGATWHAAGLVGQLRSSSNLTRLMRYGAELYGKLETETGQATGWQGVGSLRLASSPARWLELEALRDDGQGLRLPRRARVAAGSARALPAARCERRAGRRLDRGRWLRRPGEPHQCLCGGRPRRRGDARAGRSRDRAEAPRPAGDDGRDR